MALGSSVFFVFPDLPLVCAAYRGSFYDRMGLSEKKEPEAHYGALE